MATVEVVRTRLDQLQWEVNRLETENRRLQEENPEQSRVLSLGAELEQSKNESAEPRNRLSKCEQQIESTLSQLETERQTADGLREALTRSESRESELTYALEKEEGLERLRVEEEQREEARELQYYRALELEREKWEAQENRALDEVNRL